MSAASTGMRCGAARTAEAEAMLLAGPLAAEARTLVLRQPDGAPTWTT